MIDGLIDANLGGSVVKKRVAMVGQGKRGSYRTIVATHFENRWIFLFGFNKNERSNINQNELKALQTLAKRLLTLAPSELLAATSDGELIEVKDDKFKKK